MRKLYMYFALCLVQVSLLAQADLQSLDILMLDACVYDKHYSEQIHLACSQLDADIVLTTFTSSSPAQLTQAISGKDIVLVTYPNKGSNAQLDAFGKVLQKYATEGGIVVFTGTHDISKLNLFNIFHIDRGTFSSRPQVKLERLHALTHALPHFFTSRNFTYPIRISDKDYFNLASEDDRTVYGYLPFTDGIIFYVGLEFYLVEDINLTILQNIIEFARIRKTQLTENHITCAQPTSATQLEQLPRFSPKTLEAKAESYQLPRSTAPFLLPIEVARTEQLISPQAAPTLEWNVYPNPYVSRTQMEFVVPQAARVQASIYTLTGALMSKPIAPTIYEPGKYTLEIPDMPYGAYFVQLQIGDYQSTKKIIKVQTP